MTEEEFTKLLWQILTEHLTNATPIEQVHFARWTNYSDIDILKWMVNRSETDVVAALTIYFQMSPDFYAEKTLDEFDEFEMENVRFLEKIALNVKEGFYKESDISFKGSDFLENGYDFKSAKRQIPKHMQNERKGTIELAYDLPEGFDDGLPDQISEKVWSLLNTYMPEKEN